MKKIFLLPVLMTLIFSSCESTEDINEEQIDTVLKARTNDSDWVLYKNCLNAFVYDASLTKPRNIILFEKHVNLYLGNTPLNYETINLSQLSFIVNNSKIVLQDLNYRTDVKNAICDILDGKEVTNSELFNEKENTLLQTLSSLYDDTNGDDYLKKNIKTIAYAYGAQFSLTKAILYAGAVEITE